MKPLITASFAAILTLGLCKAQPQPVPLKLLQTIQLPAAVKGHFDHLAIDLKNSRLFVTPEDYKAVLVLDAKDGHLVHTIDGIGKPHAVLYHDHLNRIYVSDGVDGDLKIFDGQTYGLLQKVALLKDADSIGYDASTQALYIDNGGGDVGVKYSLLTSVDTNSGKKLADLQVDGETLEAIALDAYRPRLYVNNTAKNEITVIDRWRYKVLASWPVKTCQGNVALALDEQHQRLFAGCRSGQVAVFDTNTGVELQAFPIVKGVDDLVYDRASKRLYAAGNGFASVYQEKDADHFTSLGDVPTGPLGRTALLVPELNRYFVAVPQHGSQCASILVYEASDVSPLAPPHDRIAYEVHAPAAEELVSQTLSAHPYLRKLGLHAVQPGETDSVIIANGNATRRGIKTTDGDFKAIASGSTYNKAIEDGSFYNLKMPMFDASGRRIGLLVMEIPFTSAKDDTAATAMAESIRGELAAQIPSLSALFAAK
jgi:hypothetical protein